MTLSGGNCMTRKLVATTITVQEHKLQFGINQKMQRLSLLLNYRYVLSIIFFFCIIFSENTVRGPVSGRMFFTVYGNYCFGI